MQGGCRNPIYCIVPPYVLEGMVRHGNEHQRRCALRTLSIDRAIRAARSERLAERVQPPRPLGPTPGQPQRTIRDAGNTENVDGPVVRSEGQGPVDDVAANEAYDGFGATYAFYWQVFQRRLDRR